MAEVRGNREDQFECLRCGHCCLAAGSTLYIDQEDLNKWIKEKRKDILSLLYKTNFICDDCGVEWNPRDGNKCPDCKKKAENARYYWIDKNQPLNLFAQLMADPRCPFLKKVRNKDEYLCKIHETKPATCRGFPELDKKEVTQNEEECISWGCKGYPKWKSLHRKDD